ncbi:MAG: fructosamine kinase family protein [Chloroflexota bacterium]|nr:fructosamine kinase family protein [Chloroflexota bacterium]
MEICTASQETLETRVARMLGDTVVRSRTLTGGKMGDVVRIDLQHTGPVVAKSTSPEARLTLEAVMLRELRASRMIPVPDVLHAEDDLLVLEFIEGVHLRPEAERHCGELIARLHDVRGKAFGFGTDTLNGRIVLPSPWTESWVAFYREHRLQFSLALVDRYSPLPPDMRADLDRVVSRIDRLLREPEQPSLVHGDLWAANVLSTGDRVTAFLDPSACYSDPEIELAYVDAWGSFGREFWDGYAAHRSIEDGFHQVRKHVYAFYPLLMHVYYFGDRFIPRLQATINALTPHL